MPLAELGWTPARARQFAVHAAHQLEPARVVRQDRQSYLVQTDTRVLPAEVTGRFRHACTSPSNHPAVGDWVAVQPLPGEDRARIHALLPRQTTLQRKAAGSTTQQQVLAANVDTVLLLAGLDHDLNLRRLERTLELVWDSGALPVLLLNKADLVVDTAEALREAAAIAPGVPVIALSALEAQGLEQLRPFLQAGSTLVLLGSSGAGKSTLVNALLGVERQRTSAVREDDSRGRHTTTRRELLHLPGGAMLIDTPGLRQLQLWADEPALPRAFEDIDTLAHACRYVDCQHAAEPGCAVLAAVEEGRLPAERLASYHKLRRELDYLQRQQDSRAQQEENQRWKNIAKAQRRLQLQRDKDLRGR